MLLFGCVEHAWFPCTVPCAIRRLLLPLLQTQLHSAAYGVRRQQQALPGVANNAVAHVFGLVVVLAACNVLNTVCWEVTKHCLGRVDVAVLPT